MDYIEHEPKVNYFPRASLDTLDSADICDVMWWGIIHRAGILAYTVNDLLRCWDILSLFSPMGFILFLVSSCAHKHLTNWKQNSRFNHCVLLYLYFRPISKAQCWAYASSLFRQPPRSIANFDRCPPFALSYIIYPFCSAGLISSFCSSGSAAYKWSPASCNETKSLASHFLHGDPSGITSAYLLGKLVNCQSFEIASIC